MEEDTGRSRSQPGADASLSGTTKRRRPKGRVQSSVDLICHRLPAEVLCIVFLDLFEDDIEAKDHYSASSQVAVSHVCQYWRAVALDCPALWTRLDFSFPALTEAMLSRSKTAPLTVAYHVPTIGFTGTQKHSARLTTLQAVLTHCVDRLYRVRLSFRYLNLHISAFFSGWTRPPPILQEFGIWGNWKPEKEQEFPEFPVIELLQDAPALRHLDLQMRSTLWTDLPLNRKLTHLELHNTRSGDDFSPGVPEFLASLKQMSHLRVLELYNALPFADENEYSPVSFPNIQQLSLHGLACDIGHFFQITRLPNLASIVIVFFEFGVEEDMKEELLDALEDLQTSIGYYADPQKVVDALYMLNTSFKFSFSPQYQGEAALTALTVAHCLQTVNGVVDTHSHLEFFNNLFQFTNLASLEVEQANLAEWSSEVWIFIGSLPSLSIVTFRETLLDAFFDILETNPDPPLAHIPTAPYFPALSTLRLLSPELDEEAYEVDMQEFTDRLINILKRRVKRGYPLSELHIETLRHFNEPEVTRLRKAVPSLQVVWDGYETDSSDWDSSLSDEDDYPESGSAVKSA